MGDFALIVGLSMEVGHMMWFTMSQVAELIKMKGRCTEAINALALPPLEIVDKPHALPLVCTKGYALWMSDSHRQRGDGSGDKSSRS